MPQFQNGAASVHYEIVGSGRPILLIAGTASDGASWGPLLPLLPNRQLILIDNRGAGQTRVDGPIELDEMIEDCSALTEHLGLGAVDIVGHSLGGHLGLGVAAAHPDKVNRLVTLGTGIIDAKARVLFRDLSRLYFTIPPEDWFRLLYQWLFSAPFFRSEETVANAAAASAAYPHRQSPGDFARQVAALDHATPTDLSTVCSPFPAISTFSPRPVPSRAITSGCQASPRRSSPTPPIPSTGKRRKPWPGRSLASSARSPDRHRLPAPRQ
ncbi:MAG: alpha/beta fold hydrolase [Devosia sp.]|uniref:alpha/beta fold hydrolase n=1 Tax=Devosia sp. TaxID=1871048 RepID=UPI001AC7C746|nr:alpha/beta hydrolase [Devosia sp.]MBN9316155.1 alpha/beta fold hydrolase [Devosia sp.]